MKKKGITLTIGLVILCCLFGTYFALKSRNERISEEALTESETEPILNIDTDEIASLSFQAGDTPVTFSRKDGDWTLEGDETFPVNSSSLTSVLSCLSPLESVRILNGVSDLSEYGLDQPQNTVSFIDTEGKETKIIIGDTNSSTGDDYIMVDGSPSTIYTASTDLRQSLSSDLYTYAVSEELPSVSASKIVGVTVSRPTGGYEIGLSPDKTWQVTDKTVEPDTSDMAADELTACAADQDAVNSAISALSSSLYYSDYLEHNCTDPSAYGIMKDGTALTISYEEDVEETEAVTEEETDISSSQTPPESETDIGSNQTPPESETVSESSGESADSDVDSEQTEASDNATAKVQKSLTFYVGSTDAYGNYYVQQEGSAQVHTLSAAALSPFLGVTAADWRAAEEESEAETDSQAK